MHLPEVMQSQSTCSLLKIPTHARNPYEAAVSFEHTEDRSQVCTMYVLSVQLERLLSIFAMCTLVCLDHVHYNSTKSVHEY